MTHQRTFLLTITLVADEPIPGDLLDAEDLIASQMSGELDPGIGLFCGAVDVIDEQETA